LNFGIINKQIVSGNSRHAIYRTAMNALKGSISLAIDKLVIKAVQEMKKKWKSIASRGDFINNWFNKWLFLIWNFHFSDRETREAEKCMKDWGKNCLASFERQCLNLLLSGASQSRRSLCASKGQQVFIWGKWG